MRVSTTAVLIAATASTVMAAAVQSSTTIPIDGDQIVQFVDNTGSIRCDGLSHTQETSPRSLTRQQASTTAVSNTGITVGSKATGRRCPLEFTRTGLRRRFGRRLGFMMRQLSSEAGRDGSVVVAGAVGVLWRATEAGH